MWFMSVIAVNARAVCCSAGPQPHLSLKFGIVRRLHPLRKVYRVSNTTVCKRGEERFGTSAPSASLFEKFQQPRTLMSAELKTKLRLSRSNAANTPNGFSRHEFDTR